MSKVDYLERVISHLDTLYEIGEDCVHPDTGIIVSDGEYDAMRRELASLEPNSKVFNSPTTSTAIGHWKKVVHEPPMTSISKASHEDRDVQEEQLFKWLSDCSQDVVGSIFDLDAKEIDGTQHKKREYNDKVVTYPKDCFCQAYKLDGVALALYYKDGKLEKAGLRPRDGVRGEDVTDQVKYVNGVPEELNEAITCSIRGELVCKLSDFDRVQKELEKSNEKLRANPRNHAAGGIRQFKEPQKVEQMRLTFIAYSIEGLDNPPYKTEIEREKYCNQKLGIQFVQVRPFNFYNLQKMEDNVDHLDYEVDGIVVSVNNLEDQEQLGRHGGTSTGNPKGKIAWKFAEERANPIVKNIEWKTGRTGAIKPVAIFDAVSLAGTQVSRATLHNYGFMKRNKIDIGTQIIVLKAGKIIPKVVGVVSGQCEGDPKHPNKCPSCNGQTTIYYTPAKKSTDEMWEIMCDNDECPSKNVSRLNHFLTTLGVVGMGESRIAKLADNEKVRKFSDFFKLTLKDCVDAGLTERQSLLVLGSIWMLIYPEGTKNNEELAKKIQAKQNEKLSIPLWKLFASFGIPTAGKSAGKALVEHFKSFDKIRSASNADLETIEDIGMKTAELVSDWLFKNSDEINELLKFIEPELPKVGNLTGKKFCFTGGFAEGKKYWEAKVEAAGGKCSSSVSKKTDFVVKGIDAGSKAEKAKILNIPLINTNELLKML